MLQDFLEVAKILVNNDFAQMIKIVADENIPYVREAFDGLGQVQTIAGRAISCDLLKDADVPARTLSNTGKSATPCRNKS